ncbi:hypothetical protein HDU67_006303 [Dinochytrium kinnereticum]|nr:hypothetical protein HDU67_006303 [Dinochytrium kinnereticum]
MAIHGRHQHLARSDPFKRILLSCAVFLLCSVQEANGATCYSRLSRNDFQRCQLITPALALHWSIASDNSTITFGVDIDVASSSNKWVAIGISEMGGMKGADIYILRQHENGTYYMQDSFSSDFATPIADASQDAILLTSPEPSASFTLFTFRRPLVTCDPNDNPIVMDARMPFIWAFGDSARSVSKHGMNDRGNAEVIFWDVTYSANLPPTPMDTKSIDIRMPNITIPPSETSYLCTHLELPSDKKYHAIKYEGIPMSNLVHHIIIYGCSSPPTPPAAFGDLYNCKSMDADCSEFTFSWVPGSPPNSLPAAAGIPFGTGQGAKRYFSMQVHYDNPSAITGRVDSSGIKIFYTEQLRPNDIGVLTLGSVRFSIPGNSPTPFVLPPNICPSACTRKFPGSVKGQTPVLDETTNTILPGDALITTCAYIPTLGVRSVPTTNGESTEEEMCFNFVQYYPKYDPVEFCIAIDALNLATCTSRAELTAAGLLRRNSSSPPLAQVITNLVASQNLVPATIPKFTPYKSVCNPSLQRSTNATIVPTIISTTRPSGASPNCRGFVSVSVGIVGLASLMMAA